MGIDYLQNPFHPFDFGRIIVYVPAKEDFNPDLSSELSPEINDPLDNPIDFEGLLWPVYDFVLVWKSSLLFPQ